jgi:hypothetical protein
MSEDRLFQKAAQLYKQGNLEGAKAILEELDTEQARRALNRVNSAIASEKQKALASRANAPKEKPKNASLSSQIAEGIKQAKAEEKQAKAKQQGIALIISLFLLCSCCGFGIYMGQPRTLENLEKMCELVRSVNFQCDPEQILRDYPADVEYCQQTYGNFVDVEELKYTWQNCLRSRGVEFWPE